MRRVGVLVAALALLGARAGAAPPPPGCEERVGWIQERLARTARRLHVWQWSWGIAGGAATAAQLALVPVLDDRDTRIDLLVGAGSTLAILVPVILPPDVDARPPAAAMPCPARLADAERRLAKAADGERSARGPWMHVGNVAFNLGVGLLLGLGFGHWASGAINAGIGIAVGEAEILTLPDDSIDDLAALRAAPGAGARLVPLAAPGAVGIGLALEFRGF